MNSTYIISYWNKEGKYYKEYDTIYNIFLKGHKKAEIKETENKEINSKIKKLGRIGNKLYRFYNDGDSFVYMGKKIEFDRGYTSVSSDNSLKNIELEMDKLVSEIWAFLIKKHPQEIVIQELK